MRTIWVFGDQLHRSLGALAGATPATERILMVEARAKLSSRPWHIQRAHFLVASMRRFAADRRAEGFEVDYRVADTFAGGHRAHVAEWRPSEVLATEPNSFAARALLERLGVADVTSDQFLCHHQTFARWAAGRRMLRMEDFYRRQRVEFDYLMEGDGPAGGRWNFDSENRRPPPPPGSPLPWPDPPTEVLDELDAAVLADLPATCTGTPPTGTWATSRSGALGRLAHFVEHVLPLFGPHEDAMLAGHWHLAHSMLSPYLNNGLLLPAEVCDAAQAAYDAGRVPLASAEGFVRQVLGWREYVWGIYWLGGPPARRANALAAHRPLPPALTGGPTSMRCVATCTEDLAERAWLHHIQRLMVLGNLALLAGVSPGAMSDWMWERFVDGAEWVMVPNVLGMSLYADGGRMASKPYAAGGAYIDRMSDYCKGCAYDRKKRTGPDACPFTTLYWDFLLRHAERFAHNARIVTQVRAAQRLTDGPAVRRRADEVLALLDAGQL